MPATELAQNFQCAARSLELNFIRCLKDNSSLAEFSGHGHLDHRPSYSGVRNPSGNSISLQNLPYIYRVDMIAGVERVCREAVQNIGHDGTALGDCLIRGIDEVPQFKDVTRTGPQIYLFILEKGGGERPPNFVGVPPMRTSR